MSVLRLLPLNPSGRAARAFLSDGRVAATVVIKARYALVHGGVMRRIADAPPTLEELAPYKSFADVIFTGRAHAPGGRPVPAMPVRLALFRGEQTIFDKRLIVSGDRVATPAQPVPAAAPFAEMPLVWERALGGEGFSPNPLGVGLVPGPAGELRLPNVAYLDEGLRARPACFGAIAADAPMRLRFVAPGFEAGALAAMPTIGEGVEAGFFQSAPPDQQIPFLRGDETLVLEGLTASLPVIQTRLPAEAGMARAYVEGTVKPIAMQADTLWIDGDDGSCAIVWRGCVSAPDAAALRALVVATAIEEQSRPVRWPSADEAPSLLAIVERHAGASAHAPGTVELSQTQHHDAGTSPNIPFPTRSSSEPPRAPAAPIPGAPWDGGGASGEAPPPVQPNLRGTVDMNEKPEPSNRVRKPTVAEIEVGVPSSLRARVAQAQPPTAPDPVPGKPVDPWAKSLEATPMPVARPPAPKLPERPEARAVLYGKAPKKG